MNTSTKALSIVAIAISLLGITSVGLASNHNLIFEAPSGATYSISLTPISGYDYSACWKGSPGNTVVYGKSPSTITVEDKDNHSKCNNKPKKLQYEVKNMNSGTVLGNFTYIHSRDGGSWGDQVDSDIKLLTATCGNKNAKSCLNNKENRGNDNVHIVIN